MGTSSRVPAAARTVAVLRELARHPRPVPAATLARTLDLPRSTVYHLLAVLEREGFVLHLPEERRYALGVAAFEIGSAYLRHDGLERLARPLLRELVDEVGGTAHLGVLDGHEVLYLVKEQPPGGAALVTEVGVRLPAHLTASGRALLATRPAAQLTATFPSSSLGRRTAHGPASLRQLRDVLVVDARRGWSREEGEITPGAASVAAAVSDHTGHAVASVGLTRRDGDPGRPLDEVTPAVLATADRLRARLGGPDPSNP